MSGSGSAGVPLVASASGGVSLKTLHDRRVNGWTDAFVTGDEYGTYMADQTKRVEDVLTTLGLA
mgnify:CR=1 FL=1